MGAAYYHLGEYQQSVQCNDFCILLDPQIAEAHANLANSLQQLGHLPMAALYYQVKPLTFTCTADEYSSSCVQIFALCTGSCFS
jgi:protein O-GlcNAc transferase